jgi:hypothetical protein
MASEPTLFGDDGISNSYSMVGNMNIRMEYGCYENKQ